MNPLKWSKKSWSQWIIRYDRDHITGHAASAIKTKQGSGLFFEYL